MMAIVRCIGFISIGLIAGNEIGQRTQPTETQQENTIIVDPEHRFLVNTYHNQLKEIKNGM